MTMTADTAGSLILAELKAISEQCRTDKEFLAHPEVRRAYWQALGRKTWKHEQIVAGWCRKCEGVYRETADCPVPDPVPGSLADAVEELRAKVAEKWDKMSDCARDVAEAEIDEIAASLNGYTCGWIEAYVFDDARFRFLVFAAALNAVEAGQ